MNRTKLALTLAFVAALATPAASAGWMSHGQQEPNSDYDGAAYNFVDADTSDDASLKRVYLNAFPSNTFAVSTNPNVGLVGSSVFPTPLMLYQAVFGVWKDCNADGYIGLAESAVQEYRAEALMTDICPAGASMHNDGEWVYELIQVGRVDNCEREGPERRENPDDPCYGAPQHTDQPGILYVDHANLWADLVAPDEEPVGSSCPIRPAPRGTFSNSALMLRYADCFIGFRVAQTLSANDPTGMLGFDDPKNPQDDEDSLLNQNTPVSPFGNEYDGDGRTGLLQQGTGEPTVTVWDCTNGEASPAPNAAADPTSSSAFDAADAAVDGAAGDCDSGTNSDLYATYFSANLYGQDPSASGIIEGSNPPSNVNGKDSNDWTYTFYDDFANPSGEPTADRPAEDAVRQLVAAERSLLGASTPTDLGVGATHSFALWGPMWVADGLYASPPQSVNRNTLQPSSRTYISTYAQVDRSEISQLGLSLPAAADYKYADESCQGVETGQENGWNCNAAEWWPLDSGAETRPKYRDGTYRGAVPGNLYQLRDVDCYDGTLVRGLPARAAATDVSPLGICSDSPALPGV